MTDETSVPRHLGFILDGNRRYAKEHGMSSLEGHRKGYQTLKTVVDAAFNRGIAYVSAYVFSTENWNRTEEEVNYLMDLLLWVFKHEVKETHKKGIRVRWLGSTDRLSEKHIKAINEAIELTKNNSKGNLCFCFNYGGQQEIVDAAKKLIDSGAKSSELTIESFARELYEPEIPPVDIMVRSSGEQRISNFMLWRIAYAELMFIDKHWPAFTEEDIDLIIQEYTNRHRRFGK